MKIGICYRPSIHEQYLEDIIDKVDVLEIMPDIMNVEEMKKIKEICEEKEVEIGIHTLKSSIASPYGLSISNVEKYYYISKYLNAVYFSDHMAFSHIENKYLSSVFPIEYTYSNKQVVVRNLERLNKIFFDIPVLVENITQYNLVNKNLLEGEFFSCVLLANDMLLDLTNLYITAVSNNINPHNYISEFPLGKVKVLHISGLEYIESNLVDSHKNNLNDEILIFLRENLKFLTKLEYVFIERDFNVAGINDVLEDLQKVRTVILESKEAQ